MTLSGRSRSSGWVRIRSRLSSMSPHYGQLSGTRQRRGALAVSLSSKLDRKENTMSARPWLATYGGHISDEIDRRCLRLGGGDARRGDAAICRQARIPLLRPDAHLRRHRSALARLRRLPAATARGEEGRAHRGHGAEHSGLPDRDDRHPARRRRASERESALYASRARAPVERRRRRDDRHLRRSDADAC